MYKHLKVYQSRKDFKSKYLMDIIGKNAPQVLTQAFEKFSQNYGFTIYDRLKKNCMKMSFIDLASIVVLSFSKKFFFNYKIKLNFCMIHMHTMHPM